MYRLQWVEEVRDTFCKGGKEEVAFQYSRKTGKTGCGGLEGADNIHDRAFPWT